MSPTCLQFFVSMKRSVSILLAVSVCMTVSCVRSEEDVNAPGECISFSVAAETLAGTEDTRAAYSSEPIVLTADTADTLWLHASVEDYVSPAVETRSVPGTTGNFASALGSFRVDAYTSSDELYMSDAKVDNYSGGHWRPSDGDRFWPGKDRLSFYAVAPYAPAGISSFKADEAEGKVSFSYETPGGGDSDDAERQPDLMLAYSACSQDEAAAGAVPMHFSHALAAVRFKAKDMAGCTVKSITIAGVSGNGDCVAKPATDNGYSWTVGSGTYSYTQAFDVAVADGGEQGITASAPEKTFMMIPQTTPADAKVVIVIETSKGETLTVNGKISGHVWEAGKLYTYAISTDSINWSYVFEVTPEMTLADGHVIGTYVVKSYRYRTYNESVKEPLAWTAELKDQASVDNKDLVAFDYSGTGSVSAGGESHSLKCRPLDLLTSSWDGDMQVLRKNAPRGTESAPWDLSLDDGYTGKMTTANCYLVHASGHYRLPLVYGNAIKNGAANTSAYNFSPTSSIYLQKFPRVGGNITQPYIYTDTKPADCKLLWQDALNVVTDVRLSSDGKYLEFEVNAKNLVQGNALVAVRDASGKVLWSWHIWVTEYDPTVSGNLNPNDGTLMVVPVDDYDTPSTKYHLLSKQIGWCDGKLLTYQARQTKVLFHQVKGTDDVREMLIDQTQYVFESSVNNGAYYQWGRKDPFIGIISRDKESVKQYYDDDNDPINGLKWQNAQVSVAKGIQNPDVLYLGSQHWMTTPFKQNLWNNRISTSTTPIKTVYDPSPRGFMVADRNVYRVFSTSGATYYVGSSATLANFRKNFNGDYDYMGDSYNYTAYTSKGKKGNKIVFPATGERAYTTFDTKYGVYSAGQIFNGTYVYCWISDARHINDTRAVAMTLALGYNGDEAAIWVDGSQVGACSMARPVYCVRER